MTDLDRVLGGIDPEELVRLTQALVRIDSVARPDRGRYEAEVVDHVQALLQRWGLPVRRAEVEPGRPNLMAELAGARGPGRTLLFEAHTDVVTEGDASAWTHPPFGGVRVGDRIYGRGACDTKNNLAAMLLAARALQKAGCPFPGRILLAIPVDEEGMMTGIKAMIRAGWCDGVDAAVICEPEENLLCTVQKGALRLRIRGEGKMAHGAMPRAGVNPVTPLAEIAVRLSRLEAAECERHGEDPLVGWPSVTPTVFRAPAAGEAQLNVVPATAEMYVDVRTTPAQDHAGLLAEIERVVADVARSVPGFRATCERLDERPVTHTPRDHPIVAAAAAGYRLVTGREPGFAGVPGATDGTFLRAWAGVPFVTTGSGKRTVPHQVDEYVDIPELVEACRLYAATAYLYLNGAG